MTDKAEQPWYAEGLKFKCSGCGDCCTGAPGYVWVNKQEITALAAALGFTDVEQFEDKYVRKIGIRKSLVEFPNGDCVFFDNGTRKCAVYEYRPRQCKTWPFWDSNLKNPEAWEETCESCPGSGQGKLYSLEQIEAQRKVMKI
ncbi:MAG: YkgJ family cysteine cluster protein [Pirellulaceae bacterium]|nr:YkgJ family cysteine cluster protein [Pirellulaceae bacterium]